MTKRKLLPSNPRVELVLGGARSGKSAFAECRFARMKHPYYIATAQAHDDEMRARIHAHRSRRPSRWMTAEAPLELVETLRDLRDHPLLVDCLTLWLSNIMLAGRNVEAEIDALVAGIREARATLVLVSNEIGLGLVPETALGRQFRDYHGMMNQKVAEAAGRVTFIAAGLPLKLKG